MVLLLVALLLVALVICGRRLQAQRLSHTVPARTSEPSFRLGVTPDDGETWIECQICHRRSYHHDDVREFYCGHCHRFHLDPIEDRIGAWWQHHADETGHRCARCGIALGIHALPRETVLSSGGCSPALWAGSGWTPTGPQGVVAVVLCPRRRRA